MLQNIRDNIENLALFIGIIALTFFAAILLNRFFNRLIRRSTTDMNNDPTNYMFLKHAIVAIVYIVGISLAIYTVPGLRTLASSMLAGAGILAVAVGFASQHALSNIISGVFIVIFKPFRVNDRITLRDLAGVIEDITLRHTVIRNFENRRILIPNSLISEEILINADFKDEMICKFIEIGISYDSDIDLARSIMREEALKHPMMVDNRTPEQIEEGIILVPVRVIALAESSVNLRAWVWAKDNADAFAIGCDLMESIKKRFDIEGVEIPFPHRTVVQKTLKKS